MKRKFALPQLTIVVLACAFLTSIPSVSSSLSNRLAPSVTKASNLMPLAVTTLSVDRADDTAAATACTAAANDCSLRGAIRKANTNPGADPVVINLQPATTYSLTISNATQENAAATGDLDITTTLHTVTIVGAGSTGPNASIINAAGLNSGNMRDRVFHITAPGVTVTLQNLAIQNGKAADDGSTGISTNPTAQNSTRVGGGILNGAGIDVNGVAVNGGGTVTLANVVVQSCQVLGKGDSIVNEHTTLDAQGGGLASLGTTGNVIITTSTLTGNTALGGNGGNFNNGNGSNAKGGAIYFQGNTLNIDGSRIDHNNATGGIGADTNHISNQQNGGQGGWAHGAGAYIAAGTATINNSTFESCAATGGKAGNGQNAGNAGGETGGGGLYSAGNVTVTNSTFNMNSATGGRGGDSFGPDCFGAHQSLDGGAARGGAILADAGSLIINTATLANNSASGGNGGDGGKTNGGGPCAQTTHGAGGLAHGGAITNNNAATLNIKHATISGNSAQAGNSGVNQSGANLPARLVAEGTGGGIRVGPASVTLQNTIIAGNTAANGTGNSTGAPTPGPNVDGTVTSNGHNLLGVVTEAVGFSGTGDKVGANPMLAALADNGGPTKTMALLAGSPALDAGVAAVATFDQRGKPRTFDDSGVANAPTSDGTDIGAYEHQPACTLTCPANIIVSNDKGKCGAVVNYRRPLGSGCGRVSCKPASGSFFPVGETTITCTSSAGPSCSFKVTVKDTQAPVITTKNVVLWPANHKHKTVKLTDLVASVSDNCGRRVGIGSVRITKVTSDELEDAPGGGDGNTSNDILIAADCKSVQLRAERMGNRNGRVYTISLKVTDSSGNISTATATVTVPHSQNGGGAVDDGPQYTVVSACP